MGNRIDVLYNFWKLHHCGILRLLVVDFMFDLLLFKNRVWAELWEIHKSATGWLAFYPERRRAVLYIMGYKVILWISVDEAGSHAV